MDVLTTNSLVIGIFCFFLLALLLYLKKTDPMVGCELWRMKGCVHLSGSKCEFPQCDALKAYRSGDRKG